MSNVPAQAILSLTRRPRIPESTVAGSVKPPRGMPRVQNIANLDSLLECLLEGKNTRGNLPRKNFAFYWLVAEEVQKLLATATAIVGNSIPGHDTPSCPKVQLPKRPWRLS